jgi:hypothetical protein
LEEDIRLGGSDDVKEVDDKDSEKISHHSGLLMESLNKRYRFNTSVIVIAIILLCILFGIGVTLIFYYRDLPSAMGAVFGGTFLSLLSIIHWLYKLWREKSFMDISLGILEGLPPEKAAEFISTLYWKLRGESKK